MAVKQRLTSPPGPLSTQAWRGGVRGSNVYTARELRKETTEAEKILWAALRNRQLNNLKFRRQHPIMSYVVDFYCAQAALIVELDGSIHNDIDQKAYDKARQEELEEIGYRVIRFSNTQIEKDLNYVLFNIAKVADEQLKILNLRKGK